ncbi:MAG: hypothetical protein BJ554DRAFT_5060 [Olpidium bornovanus]|uniref:Uncharacterized protein n=1 Tax=Olpidium bornovanus TaxID=278681 RepID=A0A8H8A291_9FUNG|nr:MAG: hypothetical protein BJ554DRAFT_5060 [Olpidium bornovanus]
MWRKMPQSIRERKTRGRSNNTVAHNHVLFSKGKHSTTLPETVSLDSPQKNQYEEELNRRGATSCHPPSLPLSKRYEPKTSKDAPWSALSPLCESLSLVPFFFFFSKRSSERTSSAARISVAGVLFPELTHVEGKYRRRPKRTAH